MKAKKENKAKSERIHTMEDVDGKLFEGWQEYSKKPKKRMGIGHHEGRQRVKHLAEGCFGIQEFRDCGKEALWNSRVPGLWEEAGVYLIHTCITSGHPGLG